MNTATNGVSFTTPVDVKFSNTAVARLFLLPALLLMGCSSGNNNATSAAPPATAFTVVQMSHPAAENCASAGGTPALAYQLTGETVKMCRFPNGKQCEERVMMNGICS